MLALIEARYSNSIVSFSCTPHRVRMTRSFSSWGPFCLKPPYCKLPLKTNSDGIGMITASVYNVLTRIIFTAVEQFIDPWSLGRPHRLLPSFTATVMNISLLPSSCNYLESCGPQLCSQFQSATRKHLCEFSVKCLSRWSETVMSILSMLFGNISSSPHFSERHTRPLLFFL